MLCVMTWTLRYLQMYIRIWDWRNQYRYVRWWTVEELKKKRILSISVSNRFDIIVTLERLAHRWSNIDWSGKASPLDNNVQYNAKTKYMTMEVKLRWRKQRKACKRKYRDSSTVASSNTGHWDKLFAHRRYTV